MTESPYTDLARPPLRATDLSRALVVPDGLWTRVELHQETASTNADAVAAAAGGAPEGLVVVAERQSAGRGRLGRTWESPARAGIAVSVLLRPGLPGRLRAVPANRYGWLPLLAGVALCEAVSRVAELDATLKWPNDLMLNGRKCGGILAEAVPERAARMSGVDGGGPAVVVGIGLNVTLREAELPHPEATSLLLESAASTDRDPLVRELLRAFARWYERWRGSAGDPDRSGVSARYRDLCGTLGRDIRVSLPDGTLTGGRATTVDSEGRLVVDGQDGVVAVAAGDVVHVRHAAPGELRRAQPGQPRQAGQ